MVLVQMVVIYGFVSPRVVLEAYPGTTIFWFCNSAVLSSFLYNLLSKHMPAHVSGSVQSNCTFY